MKWIGVHTGEPHYLDHLGVFCEMLDIPLIVSDTKTFEAAQEFYPNLKIKFLEIGDLSLYFLQENADVIFESSHHFAAELVPLWELLYGKKMRVVYCPHGNSDKKPAHATRKDISLVYGDHMLELLKETGDINRLESWVVTGNYRADYYKMHQKRLDAKLEALIGKKSRKTVLYAPTWNDGQSRSSWLLHATRVIEELSGSFDLMLRWHPFLDDLFPVESEKLRYLVEQTPGVFDLSNFPAIYPILERSDFYLGDFSSIGYDYLVVDKPLFFLDRHEGEIYDCGVTLTLDQHWGAALQNFQDNPDWSLKRQTLAKKVFGQNRSLETIKSELKNALNS